MSNISKRRKEGSRAKIKSVGDHKEFLKRITKTLYYGQLPSLPCLSFPVTEVSCSVWSAAQRGRSVRRLHLDAAARVSHAACASPCALVLALLYLERLRVCNPHYLAQAAPHDLFLVSLMVGNKFLQDDGEDDEVIMSEWAASGGLDVTQIKRLEIEFLNAIEWNIFVSSSMFESGLRWLEGQVALREAARRGFFTYADLCAAAPPLMPPLLPALPPLLAALCAALPLALCALLLPPAAPLSPALAPAPAPAPYNTTLLAPLPAADPFPRPDPLPRLCCDQWLQYQDLQLRDTKKTWFDSLVAYDWKHVEPWWSKTSVLTWLYQSSLVNPMQRWLERIDEYADFFKQQLLDSPKHIDQCHEYTKQTDQHKCVRQWLNLSKLSALVVSVTDR